SLLALLLVISASCRASATMTPCPQRRSTSLAHRECVPTSMAMCRFVRSPNRLKNASGVVASHSSDTTWPSLSTVQTRLFVSPRSIPTYRPDFSAGSLLCLLISWSPFLAPPSGECVFRPWQLTACRPRRPAFSFHLWAGPQVENLPHISKPHA